MSFCSTERWRVFAVGVRALVMARFFVVSVVVGGMGL